MSINNVKKCGICEVILTKKNSYYPEATTLLCKEHYIRYGRKYTKKYHQSEKGKKATNKASKKAYIKHKEKWLARAKARYAIKKGIITKPKKCEVCEEVKPLQGHHEDYSKPLEVIFLCSSCHAEADKSLERGLA